MSQVYRLALPTIKSSGGRFGSNLVVTEVTEMGEIKSEQVPLDDKAIEMLVGDILLNIKFSGQSKDRSRMASAFQVQLDEAGNPRFHLLMITPWPDGRERLARRIKAAFTYRANNGPLPQSKTDTFGALRSEMAMAYQMGLDLPRMICIASEVLVKHNANPVHGSSGAAAGARITAAAGGAVG